MRQGEAVSHGSNLEQSALRFSDLTKQYDDSVDALCLQRTLDIKRTGDPVNAVEVLANRYTLNESERAGVLRHLVVEGDLSAYGLVNAATHFSHEVEDYDRATEFEALGGKLIELSSCEWKEVAEAA